MLPQCWSCQIEPLCEVRPTETLLLCPFPPVEHATNSMSWALTWPRVSLDLKANANNVHLQRRES